jgi:hypothetical protein
MATIHDVSEKELLAYVTGNLSAQRRQEIDRRVADDTTLLERIEAMRFWADAEAALPGTSRLDEVREAVRSATRGKQFRALRDDVRAGRAVAFVGPGLATAAGLAGAEEVGSALASRLARHLTTDHPDEIERLKRLGLHALSDLFIHQFGRPEFTRAVAAALYGQCSPGSEKLELHKMILEMPFAMVVSTNWDDLFEQAARQLDPPVFLNSVTTDEELLSLYTPHVPLLIQPRGSLRKGNAVVAEYNAYALDARHPGLWAFLRALFFTHKILFIGFELSDPSLLYYHDLFESQLGDQAGRVWARSYVFMPTTARAGAERLQQMGLQVIECPAATGTAPVPSGMFHQTLALECFLRNLLSETRSVVNRVQRSKRLADFMGESECLGQDVRGRAGLSPVGLPEKDQLNGADGRTDFTVVPPHLSLAVEYDEQMRMKRHFLHAVNRAVENGKSAKLILSTDFESIQERAVNKRWVMLQLRNLVEFFQTGTGRQESVKVVDRHGPFEVQQYIFGEGELVESVKLEVHDPTYYYARTSKDPQQAKAAAKLFDVCFGGLALRNLENLLAGYNDPGRNYLVDTVCLALSHGLPEPVFKSPEALDPLGAKLADQLRSALNLEDQDREALRANVDTMLGTSPAHVVMSVLSDTVVFQAIKEHLIAQWKQEMQMLSETRPSWIIQLANCSGEPKGELEKDTCHRILYHEEPADLYNLHVAAFAITSDARRLILRKRRGDGPYFDPGKWDRTFTGHVRKDSNYHREFLTEVLHHFEPCGVRGASFVMRQQFLECCQQRLKQTPQPGSSETAIHYGMNVVAFPLHPEPLSAVYRRLRAKDSKEVQESARSMVYLCIMPRPELPLEDPEGKHFADWAELTFDEVGHMLSTGSPITTVTVIAGNPEEIGPATMTHESWTLLQQCYREILSRL